MKRLFTAILVLTLSLSLGLNASAQKKSKRELRAEYTLANLKINAAQKKKLAPVVKAYLEELHVATDAYDDRKDELKAAIKSSTLTDKQADALLALKMNADTKEAAIRRKYLPKFKAIIGAKQTWYCFDLMNDKMSKIRGEEKK